MKRKILVFGINLLFFALALAPIINADVNIKEDLVELDDENNPLKSTYHPINKTSLQFLNYTPGELIVKINDGIKINIQSDNGIILTGITAIDAINSRYGGLKSMENVFKNTVVSSLSNIFKFKFDYYTKIYDLIKEYDSEPSIIYAEPNYIYKTHTLPNDPYFDQQWALNQTNDCDIDAPEAWDINKGDLNITIAIIDSGVDYNHSDLSANIWHDPIYGYPGYDFVDINIADYLNAGYTLYPEEDYTIPDPDPMDFSGHGTHCAGIAGAVTNNGIGIAGISWNCKIMPVRCGFKIMYLSRVLGILEFDDVAAGIVYATDNDTDVISMSFGGGYSDLMYDALDYAYSKGVILVASSGNGNTNDVSYPAGYDNVIAVSATDHNDCRAGFSNFGDWVDVAAPGVDIISTTPNDSYDSMDGTSMACPYVSGLAGLILSKNNSYTQDMVKTILRSCQDRLPPPEGKLDGRINAWNALLSGPGPAESEITSPEHGGEINGVIDITGSAYGEGFQYYILEYAKCLHNLLPLNWVEVLNSTTPVQNDVFTSFDTNSMCEEGLYNIRLTLVCDNGIYKDNIWTVVNNFQNIFYVDDDENPDVYCTTIREGILNAGDDDTVFVYNGTYFENVFIWKSIKIEGEDKYSTIVDGRYQGSVFDINSNDVIICGFTLKNVADNPYWEGLYGCVKILGGRNVLVEDNIIIPGELPEEVYGDGVYLRGSGTADNIIRDNIIISDPSLGTVVGVKLSYGAHDNLIYNNEIYGCHSCVSFVPMSSSCNDNIIESNYFHDVNIGVSINEEAKRNKVISNKIINCEMWGVFLFFADNNLINNNTILNSGIGVYLSGSGCMYNTVSSNNFSYNGIGVKIRGRSNKIYYNNFISNGQNGWDQNSNTWHKILIFGKNMGNYWDDYTGVDNDGDGIGDTPYVVGEYSKDRYPLMNPNNGSNIINCHTTFQRNHDPMRLLNYFEGKISMRQQSYSYVFLEIIKERFPISYQIICRLVEGLL